MAITAEDYMDIVNALIAKGILEAEAHASVAAELSKQAPQPSTVAPPLRDQFGRFNDKAAREFFSQANKEELAKKYFDPADTGVVNVSSLPKKEQMDIITGRNKEGRVSRPLNNTRDAIDFFKKLREGNS